MKNKLLCGMLAMLMTAMTLAGCKGKDAPAAEKEAGPSAQTEEAEKPESDGAGTEITKIAFLSNQAVDSEEWLQNLVNGLEAWEAEHDGIEVNVIEATKVDEYYAKTQAACEAGYQVIVTSYSDMAEATIRCAEEYPDVMFATLDGEIENLEDYKNIQNFRLNRAETSFVQGVVTALMTETKTVGFVGGGEYASIDELLAGYQQGIAYIDDSIKDYVVYTNTFTDPTAGKEYALSLISEGCDVIYGCAGGSGTGCAQAAQEEGVMYAACDVHYADTAPDMELGSTMYYFDTMFLAFFEDVLNGNYAPGTTTEYGIAAGASEYAFAETNTLVPDEVKEQAAEVQKLIASGEIEIKITPLHK